jgi:DNA-binding NarL/FixJ family response regulator
MGNSSVLVVDDSPMFLQVVRRRLAEEVDAEVVAAANLRAARTAMAAHRFDVALLDLNLPDAPGGEVVDLALAHHIPHRFCRGLLGADALAFVGSAHRGLYRQRRSGELGVRGALGAAYLA